MMAQVSRVRGTFGRFARAGQRRPLWFPAIHRLPSRPPSPHTSWSGGGSGRQGGARHCTNDLAPRRSPHSGRHSRTAPLPSRSRSAPAGGVIVKLRAWFSSHAPALSSSVGARRRRQRRACRRRERGRSQSREARPAERSAAGCLDTRLWKSALVTAGVIPPAESGTRHTAAREHGIQALLHFYASALLTPERTSRRSVRTSATLTPGSHCGSTPTCSRLARGVPASPWTRCTWAARQAPTAHRRPRADHDCGRVASVEPGDPPSFRSLLRWPAITAPAADSSARKP